MRVKSMIVAPEGGDRRGARPPSLVWGWAWSGAAPIAAVDVSLDGERLAAGGARRAAGAARLAPLLRRRSTSPPPGATCVRARARDAAGRVQPDVAAWNEHGYGNNAIAPVAFYVV